MYLLLANVIPFTHKRGGGWGSGFQKNVLYVTGEDDIRDLLNC